MKHWLLAALLATGSATLSAQCATRIEPIPYGEIKPVKTQAPPGKNQFVLFSTPLKNGDALEILSLRDDSPFGGHMERGVRIVHGNTVLASQAISDLPEFRNQSKSEDDDISGSYRALAVVIGCTGSSLFAGVTFHWSGDMISPEFLITISRVNSRYVISALPTISAGMFELSRSNIKSIRTWDNLHEGSCNACKTHYEIRDYVLIAGHPKLQSKRTSKQLYTSGSWKFPERAIVLAP